MNLTVSPVGALRGAFRPPSDKSLTHRAYLLAGAMDAPGLACRIENPLVAADCEATAACLVATGADIEREPDGAVTVRRAAWRSPADVLDCGNSGTSLRLLAGLLASVEGLKATLVGDDSLSRRPMRRIVEPLRAMGAEIEGDYPPVRVSGRALTGIDYASPVASAQVKSALLLAGLRAEGWTWIREPAPSRDHTERLLSATGVQLERPDPTRVGLRGGQRPSAFAFRVPADLSSAAFWLVAATLVPSSEVRLFEVGLNPTRTGVLEVLEEAGARVLVEGRGESLGEPYGDLIARHSPALRAFRVEGERVPRLIDEVPILAVLATQCDGETVFAGVGELRVKESDRIAATVAGLRALGGDVEELPDGFVVRGPARLRGGLVDAHSDHRLAMAFAVAGLLADGPARIERAGGIPTSYPNFLRDLEALAVV